MAVALRQAFIQTACAAPKPCTPTLVSIRPWVSVRLLPIHRPRRLYWRTAGMTILTVLAVSVMLSHYMLLRTATYLDRQMEFVQLSRSHVNPGDLR